MPVFVIVNVPVSGALLMMVEPRLTGVLWLLVIGVPLKVTDACGLATTPVRFTSNDGAAVSLLVMTSWAFCVSGASFGPTSDARIATLSVVEAPGASVAVNTPPVVALVMMKPLVIAGTVMLS